MGRSRNRWFVGDVVAELLAGIEDGATTMVAAHVIESEPRAPLLARGADPQLEAAEGDRERP